MFAFHNTSSGWRDGFKPMQTGAFIAGGTLIALAILVIAFPALIAFLAAFFLLFFGMLALGAGNTIRRFRKEFSTLALQPEPVWAGWRVDASPYHVRRTLFILR